MALLPLLSFSSGELDPVLHDNVTLEKFKRALHTSRNVMISKAGTILSRFPREHKIRAKIDNAPIKIFAVPNENILLEWGSEYVRIHFFDENDIIEEETDYTLDDLDKMHFLPTRNFVYTFVAGKPVTKLNIDYTTAGFVGDADIFSIPNAPEIGAVNYNNTPSGYQVDYLVTVVVNNEESLAVEYSDAGAFKPIDVNESNDLIITWTPDSKWAGLTPTEFRIYSRPAAGGAYGYLGSTTNISNLFPPEFLASFRDLGGDPDYTNGDQDLITNYGLNGEEILDLNSKTGAIYQGRLIITTESDSEALLASRPGFQNNFYRDFPYAADSALQFKAGTSGRADVLRIVDSDGLVVFTTNGPYVSSGLLSVNNLALERRGQWVIKEELPPLIIPGGLFFVDTTNTIRQLVYSDNLRTYETVEQTIFSAHLFRDRTITSWCYQDGVAPLIIVSFSDGQFATFTYSFEHQMRAWTRHDSALPVEQVEGTTFNDTSYFVVNKNGIRYIEKTTSRFVTADEKVRNPESDKHPSNYLGDGYKIYNTPINEVGDGFTFELTPVTVDDWEGDLTLEATPLGIGDAFGAATEGDTLRFFHPVTKNIIDLIVKTVTDPNTLVVTPSEEFPSEYADDFRLYRTSLIVAGLDHLEGEEVLVIADGYVVSSPYNDQEDYETLTVSSGQITLPELASIVFVARPVVSDIKTLNVTTVEQSPTMIESINVNKLYVKVFKSRGLYCANKFPEESNNEVDGTSLEGMQDLDEQFLNNGEDPIGNRYILPYTRRHEIIIQGSWDSQGQVSLRQVDGLAFEVISIIPDYEVLRRG